MSSDQTKSPYRVLARKYRPSTFDELIGHGAMVKTLSNALDAGRLAHAFILTGTRGIGKTTTARIIARGLNCTGVDGNDGPTIAPCGVCQNCVAIAEDRHQDVLEMDAASRTGRYPKLLKTLEEPPEHVKFIFATTEIRKIPVTVLSRCQRFDLKRVDGDTLAAYFATIAEKESAEIEDDALALIARAAEGSVRDGLSLLDQAIAHGDGKVTSVQVRDMLGLADRTRILDLLGLLMEGDIKASLALLRGQYDSGADPVVIIQDLLELTHWLTSLKVTPEAANNIAMAGGEVARGEEMAAKLTMPVLARCWQMLLKGLNEVSHAPMPLAAAEMVLVRLAYVSELPTPHDLARQGSDNPQETNAPRQSNGGGPGSGARSAAAISPSGKRSAAVALAESPAQHTEAEPRAHLSLVAKNDEVPEPVVEPPIQKTSHPKSLEDVIDLLNEREDIKLKAEVLNFVRPVTFKQGLIEFSPALGAKADLATRLGKRLRDITGEQWEVRMTAQAEGAATVAEQRQSDKAAEIAALESHPLVQDIKSLFPAASVREVRHLGPSLDIALPDDISGEDEFDDGDIL